MKSLILYTVFFLSILHLQAQDKKLGTDEESFVKEIELIAPKEREDIPCQILSEPEIENTHDKSLVTLVYKVSNDKKIEENQITLTSNGEKIKSTYVVQLSAFEQGKQTIKIIYELPASNKWYALQLQIVETDSTIYSLKSKHQFAEKLLTGYWKKIANKVINAEQLRGEEVIVSNTAIVNYEYKVKSSHDLKKENIEIFINGKKSGIKFNHSNLIENSSLQSFVYSGEIVLNEGLNEVSVVIQNKAGKLESQVLKIQYAPSMLEIIWLDPEPTSQNKTITSSGAFKELLLLIRSSIEVNTSDITIFINKNRLREIPIQEVLKISDKKYHYKVRLPISKNENGLNSVNVVVENNAGKASTSSPLLIKYVPPKPSMHIIAIAPKPDNLEYTVKDAQDFCNIFKTQEQKIFQKVNIDTYFAHEATSNNITKRFNWLLQEKREGKIKSNDVVIVFISSHGYIGDNNEFRIQANDFNQFNDITTSVRFDDIMGKLNKTELRDIKKILFIDACNSGGIELEQGMKSDLENGLLKSDVLKINEAIQTLSNLNNGTVVISSSQQDEYSFEHNTWENGAFTEAIIDGLKGKANTDNADQKIVTLKELFEYIKISVPDLVDSVYSKNQNPQMEVPDKTLLQMPLFFTN